MEQRRIPNNVITRAFRDGETGYRYPTKDFVPALDVVSRAEELEVAVLSLEEEVQGGPVSKESTLAATASEFVPGPRPFPVRFSRYGEIKIEDLDSLVSAVQRGAVRVTRDNYKDIDRFDFLESCAFIFDEAGDMATKITSYILDHYKGDTRSLDYAFISMTSLGSGYNISGPLVVRGLRCLDLSHEHKGAHTNTAPSWTYPVLRTLTQRYPEMVFHFSGRILSGGIPPIPVPKRVLYPDADDSSGIYPILPRFVMDFIISGLSERKIGYHTYIQNILGDKFIRYRSLLDIFVLHILGEYEFIDNAFEMTEAIETNFGWLLSKTTPSVEDFEATGMTRPIVTMGELSDLANYFLYSPSLQGFLHPAACIDLTIPGELEKFRNYLPVFEEIPDGPGGVLGSYKVGSGRGRGRGGRGRGRRGRGRGRGRRGRGRGRGGSRRGRGRR